MVAATFWNADVSQTTDYQMITKVRGLQPLQKASALTISLIGEPKHEQRLGNGETFSKKPRTYSMVRLQVMQNTGF